MVPVWVSYGIYGVWYIYTGRYVRGYTMVWYGIPSAGVWYVFRVWQDIPGYVTGYGMGYVQGDTLRMVWDTVYTPTSLYRQVVTRIAPHTIPPYRFFGFGSGGGELRAGTNGGYFHTR